MGEDAENGLALHSWVDGERLDPARLRDSDLVEAAAFVGDLARASREWDLSAIPPARDAYLCLDDAFRSPRERLAQLEAALLADPDRPCVQEALAFFRQQLTPAWERARSAALAGLAGEDLFHPFPAHMMMVSPSDFGFHNALRLAGGGLAFVDFEYAGLDSPVKLIGDFVCQADFHISARLSRKFVMLASAFLPKADGIAESLNSLLFLFKIKFCCIIMNEFKMLEAERREFTKEGEVTTRLKKQLDKAANYFEAS